MKFPRHLNLLLVAGLGLLAACEGGFDRITGQIPTDSVGNEAGGGKGGGGDDGGPTNGPPPIADDTTVDPALLLPWSEITGHIVVHHLVPGPIAGNSRRTLLIDGVKRQVRDMGDFGTYVSGIALSPDGGSLALAFYLGSAYGNYQGLRIADTDAGVGNWQTPAGENRTGFHPVFRRDGRLSYWLADTLFTESEKVAVISGGRATAHSWSPDESQIALTGNESAASYSVQLFRISDNSLRTIMAGTASSVWWEPSFAPNRAELAVKQSSAAQTLYNVGDLWLADADGGNRRLLHAPAISAYAWSPNGERLVVTGGQTGCTGCPPMEEPGVYLLRVSDGSFRKLMTSNAFRVAWSN